MHTPSTVKENKGMMRASSTNAHHAFIFFFCARIMNKQGRDSDRAGIGRHEASTQAQAPTILRGRATSPPTLDLLRVCASEQARHTMSGGAQPDCRCSLAHLASVVRRETATGLCQLTTSADTCARGLPRMLQCEREQGQSRRATNECEGV